MIFVKNKAEHYFKKAVTAVNKKKYVKAEKYLVKSSAEKYLKAKEYLACLDIFEDEEKSYKFAEDLQSNSITEKAIIIGNKYLELTNDKCKQSKGLKWLRFSASQGSVEVLYQLGQLYIHGDVLDRNSFIALEYFEKASEKGHLGSIRKVAEMYDSGQGCDYIDRETAVDYYYRGAKLGDTKCMLEVGNAFESGDTVIQNEEKAKQWYKKAAIAGRAEAMMAYASLLSQTDKADAFIWYSKAADAGNAKACVEAANILVLENKLQDAEQFYRKAIEEGDNHAKLQLAKILPDSSPDKMIFFETVAEAGNMDAQFQFGSYLIQSSDQEYDEERGLAWIEKAANQGSLSAQKYLAGFYFADKEIEVQSKGFVFLKQAAEQNDAQSAYDIGICYLNGTYCSQDNQSAGDWLKRAADCNYRRAWYLVGIMHEQGIGLWKNHQVAFEKVSKAANLGEPGAMYRLGLYYENGIAKQSNALSALEQFEKARECGYVKASYNIGHLYESGKLESTDYSKAIEYYNEAIGNGVAEAMNNLGNMYHNGRGVEQDIDRAKNLYQKAIDNKLYLAKYNMALLLFQQGEANDRLAIKLLEDAAKNNILEADHLLGNYYSTEEENNNLSIYHFEKAAVNNHIPSIESLIDLYSNFNNERKLYWQEELKKYN